MSAHPTAPSNHINYHKPSEKQTIKCDPDELAKVLMETMNEWNDNISSEIESLTVEYAKWGVKELKKGAPVRKGGYAKSMSYDLTKGARFTKAVLRNRKHYQLTHLLEKGHKTQFTTGKYGEKKQTEAIEHWKPVEEKINEDYYNEIKKIIGETG